MALRGYLSILTRPIHPLRCWVVPFRLFGNLHCGLPVLGSVGTSPLCIFGSHRLSSLYSSFHRVHSIQLYIAFIYWLSEFGWRSYFRLMDFVKPEAEMFNTCRLYRERWKRKVGLDIWTNSAFLYLCTYNIFFLLSMTVFWTCSEAISKPSQRIFGKMDCFHWVLKAKIARIQKKCQEGATWWLIWTSQTRHCPRRHRESHVDTRARSRVSFCVVVNLPSSRQRDDRVWFVRRQPLQCQTPVYKIKFPRSQSLLISGVFLLI